MGNFDLIQNSIYLLAIYFIYASQQSLNFIQNFDEKKASLNMKVLIELYYDLLLENLKDNYQFSYLYLLYFNVLFNYVCMIEE